MLLGCTAACSESGLACAELGGKAASVGKRAYRVWRECEGQRDGHRDEDRNNLREERGSEG